MSISNTDHATSELRATEPISSIRFVIALSLVSLAAFAFWSTEGAIRGMLGLPLVAANFVMMSRTERNRPVTRNHLISILVVLGVVVVCIVLFRGERTAETRQQEIEQLQRYSHAYFVVPIWALICYTFHRRYRTSHLTSQSSISSGPATT